MAISHQAIREFERAFNAGELSVGLVLGHRFVRDESMAVVGHRIVAKVSIGVRTHPAETAMVIAWEDDDNKLKLNPVPVYPAEAR